MTQPSVVWNRERKLSPLHRLENTKDAIDDTEGGLQVRVLLVMLGSHCQVPVRDRLEHSIIGFATDALALDSEVEKGLGTEVSLVPEFWYNHGTS